MQLLIHGCPRTKKNSAMIAKTRTGRPFILPSKQYREYEQRALSQLGFLTKPIDYPVNVKCIYYMETRRKVDLVNLLEATDDILVKAGILADDNSQIVVSHDGSRVLHDKESPRVEILIEAVDASVED